MKAQELKIGSTYNSVKFNNPVRLELSDIVELYNKCEGSELTPNIISEMFEPIKLTQEWLLKSGAKKINNSMFRKGALTFQGCFDYDNLIKGFRICLNGKFLKNVFHVHDYQNLYHALTD